VTVPADLDADLRLALSAVHEAGRTVMEFFGHDLAVAFKAADQPLTAADLAADALLRERLLSERPGYGWLSEESASSPDRLERRRVWVVDPIDGTNSFVEARPEFVVSVGLVEEDRPIVAVLLNPATGETYHATAGGGAFLDGAPIRVPPAPAPPERPVLLASRFERDRGDFRRLEARWEIRGLGSTAYRMVKVAEGAAHAFVSRSRKSEWDLCAAALVVREAGGRATQGDGSPLRFNQPVPAFDGVAVLGPAELQLVDGLPTLEPGG
jgi:myo-inositol-1(or 4)-monophosphatase